MFEKSLQDLVKGIRNNKSDPSAYIAACVAEIKAELKSRDSELKAQAVQKLTYLHMLGNDIGWAAFNIVEVLSQERFGFKRIGCLAASQSFTPTTDVILLCTQQFKRDFQAKNVFEVGVAINCIANICTPDLARDLLSDTATMLTSSRPYIRKKATLAMYKLYLQYPQGLRLTFEQLRAKLGDENVSVQSCAVNVICELANKKPKNYLMLAQELFALLGTSHNNWMLIKVAKEEPRLARKLLEPLANIVSVTPAKSLMYECISTITQCLPHTKKEDGTDMKVCGGGGGVRAAHVLCDTRACHQNVPAVVGLCADKLREFIRDSDQNLKYLGLVGLVNLMRSHPRVVAEHKDLVLQCLTDEDITIRLRALELLTGMVTRRNLPDIVQRLYEHVLSADGHYRDELIDKIIFICSRDKYDFLEDFAWYVAMLVKLAGIKGTRHGGSICEQLLNVAMRVESVRPFAVAALLPMLSHASIASGARGTECEVLYAAAWTVGEYAEFVDAGAEESVLDALVQRNVLALPGHVQAAYMQAVPKLVSTLVSRTLAAGDAGAVAALATCKSVCERLTPFARSVHVEVQERAATVQHLFVALGVPYVSPLAPAAPVAAAVAAVAPPAGDEPAAEPADAFVDLSAAAAATLALMAPVLRELVGEELKPVNPKAQRKVAAPEGLDLDAVLAGPEAADGDDGAFEDSMGASFNEVFSSRVDDAEFAGAAGPAPRKAAFASDPADEGDVFAELGIAPAGKGGRGGGRDRGARRDKSHDLFILPAARKSVVGESASLRGAGGEDVDNIPMKTLAREELGPAVDTSIFGDFGEDAGRKKRGGKKGAEPPAAPRASVSYKVAKDDEMPAGAAESDEEDAGAKGKGRGKAKKAGGWEPTSLDDVDITTPLGADEVMPSREHRTTVDAGRKSGKKDKKEGEGGKHRHSSKKDKEGEAEGAGKKEKKEKKDKKEKGGAEGAAAALPAAPAVLGAPSPRLAAVGGSSPRSASVGSRTPTPGAGGAGGAPPSLSLVGPTGDEHAAAEAAPTTLYADKALRVVYIVAASIRGTATVSFRSEARSTHKPIESAELAFGPGGPAGVFSLGSGLCAKPKAGGGKAKNGRLQLSLDVRDVTAPAVLRATVKYAVAGGKTGGGDVEFVVRAASALVPAVIDLEAYQRLTTNPPSEFFHASGAVTAPPGVTGQAAVARLLGFLRMHAVKQSANAAILYALSAHGHHVTALLKAVEPDGVSVIVKCTHESLATVLLAEVTAFVSSTPLDT